MVPGQGPGWRHELNATSAGTEIWITLYKPGLLLVLAWSVPQSGRGVEVGGGDYWVEY